MNNEFENPLEGNESLEQQQNADVPFTPDESGYTANEAAFTPDATAYEPAQQSIPQYQPNAPVYGQTYQQSYNNSIPYYTSPQQEPYRQYQPVQPKKKKKKSGWNAGKVIALALSCALVGGAISALICTWLLSNKTPTLSDRGNSTIMEGERETSVIDVNKIDTSKILTAAEVYALNVNSTVGITTSVTTNFWGYQTTSAASGSGFILTDDGYIITNFHVIENSNSITVSLYDGTAYSAALIGYDESNDLAVLKVEAQGLTPVVLGNSENMNVGDDVIAIGNPLGELTFSLTAGKISALEREVTMSNGITMNLMQTDCAINSGNSGGALFNLYGEVIGITNAKYSSSSSSEASIDNIGFAIPMDDVRGIIESIIEKGYISKPYIGVSVTDVSAETQSYGLPQGAAVREVVEGGPAAEGGLQANDIITHVNGAQITGSSDLVKIIGDSQPNDQLTLTIYRQGQTLELTVTIGEQIQSATQLEEQQQQQQQQQQQVPFPFYGFGGW